MNNLNHNDKSPVIEALTSYFALCEQQEIERNNYARRLREDQGKFEEVTS